MKRKLSRGSFLKAGGGAVVGAYVLGLAGCGGGEGDGAQLQMTWWGAQERHERTNQALELFQEENPETNIDTQFTDWEGYWDQLATQTAGGNAPDLIQMSVNYVSEYAGRDALLDLEQFVPDTIDLSNFDEGVLQSGRVDGELYGVTIGDNTQLLVYDATVLDEVGVQLPGEDWAWDDFTRLANQISEATDEGVYGTEDLARDEPAFEVFIRGRGKEFYTEEGQLGIDREDLVEWWEYWQDLRGSGAAPPAGLTAEASTDDIENSPLVRGLAVVGATYTNLFQSYQSATEREIEIHAYPTTDSRRGEYVRASQLISGSADSDHPEEVAAVIDFLLNDPDALEALGNERGVPGSSEAQELLRPELSEVEQKEFDHVEFITENSIPLTIARPQGAGEIAELLIRLSEDVAFERASIDEAVERFFSEAERILG